MANEAIPLRVAHAAYLLAKGGCSAMSIHNELGGGYGIPVIRRMMKNAGWEAAKDRIREEDYYRRGLANLVAMYHGRLEELEDIPIEEMLSIRPVLTEADNGLLTRMLPDGRSVTETRAEEMFPDVLKTLNLSIEAGAGPEKSMAEIARMLKADCLAYPTKVGVTFVPIPEGVGRTPDGGIVMMGQEWGPSFIIPDIKAREAGLKMQKDLLGLTDSNRASLMMKRAKLVQDEFDREWKEFNNRRKIEKDNEARQEKADKERKEIEKLEVGQEKARITIVMPKRLTADQITALEIK